MAHQHRYRLLMVDDDAALSELLVDYFERFGHSLQTATTAAEGRLKLESNPPDLLILDVMLPDANGMDLCREIRAHNDIPILMLTARGDLPDKVLGLELGADDYVAKPFEPRELVARIESLLRRTRGGPLKRLSASGLVLEVETRRVTLRGTEIELTSTEFQLLRILMESHGRVLSRDSLLMKLRGIDSDAYDRAVDMTVSRLRKKLDDDSHSPRFIKTIWGTGYQFVGAQDS